MGTVVLYSGIGIGHLIPMVELAKLFHLHGYRVAILAIHPPEGGESYSKVVAGIAAANPFFSLQELPPVDTPPTGPETDPATAAFDLIRLSTAHLRSFLRRATAADSGVVRAVVLDLFCGDAISVVREQGIPAYMFCPSGATALAVFLHVVSLDKTTTSPVNFKDLGDSPISFPGTPPIPANQLPAALLDRESGGYKSSVHHLAMLADADGIFVNTFDLLESRALRALKDGACLPARPTPPIYAVGPLVSKGKGGGAESSGDRRHECLKWLDTQPEKSVVFLCFGSLGSFSPEQMTEIAVGLENSGHRFLWVVKNPVSRDPEKFLESVLTEPDLDAVLPDGFLERTAARGMVVKMWAPQVEVLSHPAVGAFASHCGWNSVMEAVTAGVPVLCWPLYAEQAVNKVFLVKEIMVGVEVDCDAAQPIAAEKVEKAVRSVMDESEGAKELRRRTAAVKERAEAAAGGSSSAAFLEFLRRLP